MSLPLITLTTDFGRRDPYVAAMKGVIYRGCPVAQVADLTHEIAPQDVREAARFVADAMPFFRAGSVHVVVVDPGVGSARKPILVVAGRQIFVCPDNGVLSLFLIDHPVEAAFIIENPDFMRSEVSATFHGRDIFAYTAARIAAGVDVAGVGPQTTDLVTLDWTRSKCDGDSVTGEVVRIDTFGNAITNIHRRDLPEADTLAVEVGETRLLGIYETYACVPPRELLALLGSTGYVEIAVNQGSAAVHLGLHTGAEVRITPRGE
jgi:S-adenosylmethionine hydrolase